MKAKKYVEKPSVVIVDYGMGNLRSVINAIHFLGAATRVSSDPNEIANANAIILPGVGAFGKAMYNLKNLGLVEAIREAAQVQEVPLLGICLGMQLLASSSEEKGISSGLGLVEGKVQAMTTEHSDWVPHVGWGETKTRSGTLFGAIPSIENYYFDHSFHLLCDDSVVAAKVSLKTEIVAAIEHRNVMACQFHPEKSQRTGLHLLRRFLDFCNKKEFGTCNASA